MKHLMSTINTTLQDSLLRNSRGGSLHSDGLTPDTSEDSMRSSTISSSSVAGAEKQSTEGGFEAADSDFVYETSCSLATKQYALGKQLDTAEVPVTVATKQYAL